MSLRRRLPDWSSPDDIIGSVNDESEMIKIKSYRDLLARYVEQPQQLWATFNSHEESYSITDLLNNRTLSMNLVKMYPVMPTFKIQDTTCCTPPEAIKGPITLTDGTRTLKVDLDIPPGEVLEIHPDGTVKLQDKLITCKEDSIQTNENSSVPVGQIVKNRKIMQIITPNTTIFQGVIFKFDKLIGNPTDDLEFEFWELDQDTLEPTNKIDSYEFENNKFSNYGNSFEIDLPFSETVLAGNKYGIVVRRELFHDNANFFSFKASDSTAKTNLMSWNGTSWDKIEGEMYYKIKTSLLTGDYPILYPPNPYITIGFTSCTSSADDADFGETALTTSLTCTFDVINLEKVYARSKAFTAYPLKQMDVLCGNTIIKTKKFKIAHKYYCYLTSIDAADIPIPDNLENLNLTLNTQWHWFDKQYTMTFPQTASTINTDLDSHAKALGMFRRQYRTDLKYYEYKDTYPLGYPYSIEQDYQLEKRLMNEYVRNAENCNKVYLYDVNKNPIIELESKLPSTDLIDVYLKEGNKIELTCFTQEKETITESYTFTNSIDTVKTINQSSDLLSATTLNRADTLLVNKVEILRPQGIYERWGLLASEIYGYLGVKPTIKDMVDYCLIWGKRDWGGYVWGGGDYLPGVFRLDIPYPSPSNFNKLTKDEIDTVIGRCKKLGTKGLFSYSIEANVSINVTASTFEETIEPETLKFGLMTWEGPIPPLNCDPTVKASLGSVEVDYTFNSSSQIKVDASTSVLKNGFYINLDSDFKRLSTTGLSVGRTGSNPYLQIAPTTAFVQKDAQTAWDEKRPDRYSPWGFGLTWRNTWEILPGGGASYCDNGTTYPSGRWPETNALVCGGFDFSEIPDDAQIIGIQVTFSSRNPGEWWSQVWTNCQVRTAKGNITRWQQRPPGWYETTYGSNVDNWGLTDLKGSDVNNDNFNVALWFGAIGPGTNVMVDWARAVIWYQTIEGTFMTQRAVAENENDPYYSKWSSLEQGLINSLPPACSITYDILREGVSAQSLNMPDYLGIGSTIPKIEQSFVPTTNRISSISLYSKGKVSAPSDDLKMSLYKIDNGVPGNILQEAYVSSLDWPSIEGAEVNFTFDQKVTPNSIYGFSIERTNILDSSHYCKMAFSPSDSYSAGKARYYQNGVWKDYYSGLADVAFKAYYPIPIVNGVTAPYNMANIPYTDIRVRGSLKTSNLNYTPKVDFITVDREVLRK